MAIMKIFKKFTLWVLLASATLTVMTGSIIAPVLNLLRDGLGVDPASVGLIITTHALFMALFSPLIGNLIDRVGARKLFVSGLVLYGLAGGSGLFITSYWVLIVSRAILGIAVAAIATTIAVTILNLYKGVERNKIMGWRGSANSFGGIIWPLIGGFLGGFSWHLPFAVYFLGIPLGFFALITMPETRKEKNQNTGSVLKVFRIKPVLFVIYGLLFLTMTLLYTIVVFLPQLLETMGISSPFYISLFLAVTALSAGLTSLMYGKIKSRLSYKMIVLIALSLWTVGFTAISQASSSVIIAASVALFGVGQGMVIPAIMVWAGETVATSFRGRIISYLIAFGFIGQFSSTIIFGPVSLSFGLNGVFLMAGVICALLLVISVAIRK
ncbi:MAG: MFS transporter [Hadesarchaea archaeon]|nr:MFS transporter [Hadesarchaea archaeon]